MRVVNISQPMITIRKAIQKNDLNCVYDIRRLVFIEEQHCPPEFEWEHEDESVHFLAEVNGIPAGTARWRQTNEGFKLQRFAVLKEFRGMGIGQALVAAVLKDLPADAQYVYLHGQIQACALYEKFGFEREGEEFDEVGIRHYKMVLRLNERS